MHFVAHPGLRKAVGLLTRERREVQAWIAEGQEHSQLKAPAPFQRRAGVRRGSLHRAKFPFQSSLIETLLQHRLRADTLDVHHVAHEQIVTAVQARTVRIHLGRVVLEVGEVARGN